MPGVALQAAVFAYLLSEDFSVEYHLQLIWFARSNAQGCIEIVVVKIAPVDWIYPEIDYFYPI